MIQTTVKTNFLINDYPTTTVKLNAYFDGLTGQFVFSMEDLTPFTTEDNQNEFKPED